MTEQKNRSKADLVEAGRRKLEEYKRRRRQLSNVSTPEKAGGPSGAHSEAPSLYNSPSAPATNHLPPRAPSPRSPKAKLVLQPNSPGPPTVEQTAEIRPSHSSPRSSQTVVSLSSFDPTFASNGRFSPIRSISSESSLAGLSSLRPSSSSGRPPIPAFSSDAPVSSAPSSLGRRPPSALSIDSPNLPSSPIGISFPPAPRPGLPLRLPVATSPRSESLRPVLDGYGVAVGAIAGISRSSSSSNVSSPPTSPRTKARSDMDGASSVNHVQRDRADMEGRVQELMQRNEQLQAKLQATIADTTALHNRMKTLTDRNQQLERDQKQATEQAKKAAEKIKELNVLNERYEEAKNRARAELKESIRQMEKMQDEHGQILQRLSSQDKMIEQLIQEKTSFTAELEARSRALSEVDNDKGAMMNNIRKQGEVIQRLMSEKDDLEARLRTQMTESARLAEQAAQAAAHAAESSAAVVAAASENEGSSRKKKSSGDDDLDAALNEWLAREVDQSDGAGEKRLKAELAKQRKVVAQLSDDNAALMGQLASQSRASAALVDECYQWKKEQKKATEAADNARKQLETIQAERDTLTQRITQLQDERRSVQVLSRDAAEQNAPPSPAIDSKELQRQLDEATEHLHNVESQLAIREEELQRELRSVARLRNELAAAQSEPDELFSRVAEVERELSDVQVELRTARNETEGLRRGLDVAERRVRELEEDLDKALLAGDKLRKHNEVLARTLAEQENAVESMAHDLERLRIEAASATQSASTSEAERAVLEKEVSEMLDERKRLITAIGVQARRVERLDEENTQLRGRLSLPDSGPISAMSRPISRARTPSNISEYGGSLNGEWDEVREAAFWHEKERLKVQMLSQAKAFEKLVTRLSSFRSRFSISAGGGGGGGGDGGGGDNTQSHPSGVGGGDVIGQSRLSRFASHGPAPSPLEVS